jgi:hypothetical protein
MAIVTSKSNQTDDAVNAAIEKCEACGKEFGCGASLAGCWCSDVKLSDAARAELGTRYKRCLCPNCLEQIASGERNKDEEQTLG